MAISITDSAQLAQIGLAPEYPSNGSYILANDITITGPWTMLPLADGIMFDGNNHTISSLDMPLFTNLQNADVRNLVFNSIIDETGIPFPGGYGALGALAQQASDSIFTNITVRGYVIGEFGIGGLIGDLHRSMVIGCVNQARVVSYGQRSGGIVSLGSDVNFESCVNYGQVQALDTDGGWGGGIAGVIQYIPYIEPASFYVTNCVNYGAIEAQQHGGGIAGWMLAYVDLVTAEIINCANHGTVSAVSATGSVDGENQYYGGIFGSMLYGGTMTNCTNDGAIRGNGFVGGIIGRGAQAPYYETLFLHAFLTECKNSGSVTLTAPVPAPVTELPSYQFAGGIAGTLQYQATVTDCENSGTVTSNAPNTGGICGNMTAGVTSGCINSGPVSGTDNTGGIEGMADWIMVEPSLFGVKPATDYYVVTTEDGARFASDVSHNALANRIRSQSQRIAARAPRQAPGEYRLMSENVNTRSATITASGNNTGGIAGHILNGIRVLDNRNCAVVESTGSNVGGIVGLSEETTGPQANEISGNMLSSPSVSGATSVYRVLGQSIGQPPTSLNNTQMFPNVLLTGNNTADGGFSYANQAVFEMDPQLGATLRQGATLVCLPGQHLEDCVGCVGEPFPPTPPPPSPCRPFMRCLPSACCSGRSFGIKSLCGRVRALPMTDIDANTRQVRGTQRRIDN